MKERLSQLLGQPVTDVQKIFGDASYRTYFRIHTQGGETFVLMAMPEGKMSVSEEITNLKEKPKEPPYINIQKYLKSLGLPVPDIKLFSEKDRWLVLEDLGDTKLWDLVNNAGPNDIKKWYKKVIDLLVILQNKTRPNISTSAPASAKAMTGRHQHTSTNCIAFHRSFDATLLNSEFEHFWEYYVEMRIADCGLRIEDEELFKQETRKITEELCALPQEFVHRDYQSRNLMVHNNQLYILDFQDALLGPEVYDIVNLLRDSYVDLTPYLEELGEYYAGQIGRHIKKFWRAFHLQTVQRKLKDAGRFVFIDKVKKNPNFLLYIPVSLSYVKQALEKLPERKDLYDLLNKLDCFPNTQGNQQ